MEKLPPSEMESVVIYRFIGIMLGVLSKLSSLLG